MKWIRTWPAVMPHGRNYVADQMDRVTMDRDYRPVLDGIGGDTVVAEWDIAFGLDDMERFTAACEAQPGRVRVAPYRLYPRSTGLDRMVWAHRNADGTWIGDGQPACDLFGFGLVYLPRATAAACLAQTAGQVSDDTFSRWHCESGLGPVAVEWDVRAVHLHY